MADVPESRGIDRSKLQLPIPDKSAFKDNDIFRLLVEAVNDYAIFALDAQGFIQTWNRGARRLKGYEASEVIGSHFSRFYTSYDIAREHPKWELEQAAKNGTYEEEGWRIKKDGSRFWVSVVITALRAENGELCGFGKVTRDLTQKKIAEDKLRESEERFRLMIAGVKDYAIFALDPLGNITTWNEGAERNKGYKADEIIGQHFSVFYPLEDIETAKPSRELQGAKQDGRFEDTGWRLRKNGTRFWANVIITAIYDKENKLLGFSKVTRDLTEQKKAQDALRESHEILEKRVVERTADLAKAKELAEQAVRSRDELFAIANHELRTPLTSLSLKSQLAKRSYVGKAELSPAEMKFLKYVDGSEIQITRLIRLVEEMLDLARISQGRIILRPERIDLCEITRKVIQSTALQFQESMTLLEFKECGEKFVQADSLRVEQVILNLLTNALRYAPGRPVALEIKAAGDFTQLIVRDQGAGIVREDHEKIFDRYERLKASSNIKGLGVGLYLSRLIALEHLGSLHVESEPGKGATFILSLPTADSCKADELREKCLKDE